MNKFLLSLAFLATTANMAGQDSIPVQNPIEREINNLIESSNDYQGYKVVDYNELINVRNSTSQHFAKLNEDIIVQKNTIDQQQDQIIQLQEDLDATRQSLEEVNAEKESISFLGIPFSKANYKALMWGIVALLVLALLFFIFRYKKEHSQTKEAQEKLHSTEKEFEAYRAKALEKEQRLGRLLQDERNKTSDK